MKTRYDNTELEVSGTRNPQAFPDRFIAGLKRIQIRLFLMSGLFLIVSTLNVMAQDEKRNEEASFFKTNMGCHECELKLTNELKFEKGVRDLKIDLASNTIKVVYKTGKNTAENLAKTIEKKGYEAKKLTANEYADVVKTVEKGQK